MNGIARIEKAIAEGTISEPVLPVRLYALTTSERHLIAGSDWRLILSADTPEEMEAMRADFDEYAEGSDLYHTVVVDGRA